MAKEKKKPVTIFDVARHAGVSASTVSRALTGNVSVTPEKQAIIMASIEALGYRPNSIARELSSGASRVVGVLAEHIASPFDGQVLEGIEEGLENTQYSPMIIPGNWRVQKEQRALDLFLERRVDSMIILGGSTPDERLRALVDELPFVIIGRSVPGIEAYCLTVDNYQGGYNATKHLITLGHTRIAHIGGAPSHQDTINRQQGYQQALLDAGLPVDPELLVWGDFQETSGLAAMDKLLARDTTFSAVFAANDQMAQGAQLALYRRGMRVPADISVVGFDDQPGSAFTRPPLTTVRQPAHDMGILAAQGVLAMLRGESPNLPTISPELIVRESAIRVYSGRRHRN